MLASIVQNAHIPRAGCIRCGPVKLERNACCLLCRCFLSDNMRVLMIQPTETPRMVSCVQYMGRRFSYPWQAVRSQSPLLKHDGMIVSKVVKKLSSAVVCSVCFCREETYRLCSAPLGHVASLSTQKFSSNVMEACLERALPEVQVCRVFMPIFVLHVCPMEKIDESRLPRGTRLAFVKTRNSTQVDERREG